MYRLPKEYQCPNNFGRPHEYIWEGGTKEIQSLQLTSWQFVTRYRCIYCNHIEKS